MLQKIIDKIPGRFKYYIVNYFFENQNELHIVFPPERIKGLCGYFQQEKCCLVSMFANDETIISSQSFVIYYVFADRNKGIFIILETVLPEGADTFISIADKIYTASGYEREIKDLFGLEPVGHPDPRRLVWHNNWPEDVFPLRKEFSKSKKPPFVNNNSEFLQVEGEGVYEIPVGPVHAGIIEPGHFRFSVSGEPIINLEAQLYFTHKGIEKLSEGMDFMRCLYLAERISGDETFANSLAYCQAIEKIAKLEITPKAAYSRVIFAELERLTSHLGDLGGICLDVAYGFAGYQFRLLRMWAFALADELCGMRFLRSVNKPGGLRKDFITGKEKIIKDSLNKIKNELQDTIKIIKAKNQFIDRVEHTGVLEKKIARDLNATGPAGRASGIFYDVRKSFPYAAYESLKFQISEHNNGDVNCRMNVKLEECLQSIELMLQCVELLPTGKITEEIGDLPAYQTALSYTESPRGENIHWVMTGNNNTIYRYKIRTPSFCNWPALCYAVQGNIVTDFPLINKSFNLSYAGNDL